MMQAGIGSPELYRHDIVNHFIQKYSLALHKNQNGFSWICFSSLNLKDTSLYQTLTIRVN